MDSVYIILQHFVSFSWRDSGINSFVKHQASRSSRSGYMHIVQSGFWDSHSGDSDNPDPSRNLEEFVLWKSEIHYEKLISLLNRASNLRRLTLNDVYLYYVNGGKSWSDFFDYFFQYSLPKWLEINIQGMLWTSWLTIPWKRLDMFEYF
jgi:hypothetical protein